MKTFANNQWPPCKIHKGIVKHLGKEDKNLKSLYNAQRIFEIKLYSSYLAGAYSYKILGWKSYFDISKLDAIFRILFMQLEANLFFVDNF